MSSNNGIIDEAGTFWASDSVELKHRLLCINYKGKTERDIVRNIGFILIKSQLDRASIFLNVDLVSDASLAACFYWLSDNSDKIITIQYTDQKLGFSLGRSGAHAVQLIAKVVNAKSLSRRLKAVERPISIIYTTPSSEFKHLLDIWTENKNSADLDTFSNFASIFLGARYSIVERKRNRDLVFNRIGNGFEVPDKNWRKNARGSKVEAQPDKECWSWAVMRYDLCIETQRPTITDIDANIYWPETGWVSKSYRRLLLPFKTTDGTQMLMCANETKAPFPIDAVT